MYPKEIADLIREPRFCGVLENANARGSDAKFDCGCFLRVEMHIGGSSDRIDQVSYKTNGCGFIVEAAESVSTRLRGMRLTELNGQIHLRAEVADRSACSRVVLNAFRAAFADHRTRRVEEFRGEKALICTCFGVAEETVEEFVRSSHPADVSEVSQSLRAGAGCGSCRMLIQEIIDANA
ncbi:MAG: (2Fe-2S)-binding protein [Pyrinomonadaceae bacterium]